MPGHRKGFTQGMTKVNLSPEKTDVLLVVNFPEDKIQPAFGERKTQTVQDIAITILAGSITRLFYNLIGLPFYYWAQIKLSLVVFMVLHSLQLWHLNN